MPDEVEKLLQAAKNMGRYGQRNYTLLLMMYQHGLRVSEAITLAKIHKPIAGLNR